MTVWMNRRRAYSWRVMGVFMTLGMVCWLVVISPNAAASPVSQHIPPTPDNTVVAIIAVDRAVVFPAPDRNADVLTYLFEREHVPIIGQTPDSVFLLVTVDNLPGWILRAQVELLGNLSLVPIVETSSPTPTHTHTPMRPTETPSDKLSTPTLRPTQTPLPTPTRVPDVPGSDDITREPIVLSDDTASNAALPPVFLGESPPLNITLPDGWEAAHLIVPFRMLDGQLHNIPLTVYFGALASDVKGFVYLYWGFPNTVDYHTGEYNLWADGAHILRGSLVGTSCNLGVYDRRTFPVGGVEGIGAYYQAAECEEEADTAGWFAVLRMHGSSFAFYTAIEPWNARADYHNTLQAILDAVEFLELADE